MACFDQDVKSAVALARMILALQPALIDLAMALAGVDLDDEKARDNPRGEGAREPLAKHHERLFAIATGWLGWTPDVAWHATPREIMAAFKGRCDLLAAIFGSAEKDKPSDAAPMSLDDKLARAMARLSPKAS
ncbi:MAG: hypothetical protein ACFE0R_16730 [Salinarimonas sp.]